MFSTAADMAPIVRARTRSAAPGTPAAARSAQKSAISAAAPSSTVDSCHSGAEHPASASMAAPGADAVAGDPNAERGSSRNDPDGPPGQGGDGRRHPEPRAQQPPAVDRRVQQPVDGGPLQGYRAAPEGGAHPEP